MITVSLPGTRSQDRTAALLTLRRYGLGTYLRIGTIPQICLSGSPVFSSGQPGWVAGAPPAIDPRQEELVHQLRAERLSAQNASA
jgi:hypothetical protein